MAARIIPFPPRPPDPPTPWESVVSDWLQDLTVAGRARWTRKKHSQELRRLGRWLELAQIDWRRATAGDLARYVRTRSGLSASARGATIVSLRVFYAWAEAQGLIARSPAAALAVPSREKPQPKALTHEAVRQLLAWLAAQTGQRARRDEALLTTAIYTGLRCAELAALVWEDCDLDTRSLTIRLSKGRHGRVVPLHEDLVALLKKWRAQQGRDGSGPVFGSAWDGAPVAPARVGKICRRVAKASGVRFTAHTLRHTFATTILRQGGNLLAISKALGHMEIRTTEIYLSVDIADIRRAVGCLPAIGAW